MSDQRSVPPIPQVHRPPPPPVPHAPSTGMPKIAAMPVQPVRQNDPNLEPLTLVDDIAASGVAMAPTPTVAPVASTAAAAGSVLGPNASKIQAFGVAQGKSHLTKFKRPTNVNGFGACRVRTFHGRLSDEGLAYMDDKINEWLDSHPDVEVKFCTSTVGQYEGKLKEPALIVNVWY